MNPWKPANMLDLTIKLFRYNLKPGYIRQQVYIFPDRGIFVFCFYHHRFHP